MCTSVKSINYYKLSYQTCLVEENNVGDFVPRVRVIGGVVSKVVYTAWTVFHEETKHGAASWTTVEPKDEGVVLRIATGLEEPKEETRVFFDVQVARVLCGRVD